MTRFFIFKTWIIVALVVVPAGALAGTKIKIEFPPGGSGSYCSYQQPPKPGKDGNLAVEDFGGSYYVACDDCSWTDFEKKGSDFVKRFIVQKTLISPQLYILREGSWYQVRKGGWWFAPKGCLITGAITRQGWDAYFPGVTKPKFSDMYWEFIVGRCFWVIKLADRAWLSNRPLHNMKVEMPALP